jgi:hypothetical protein
MPDCKLLALIRQLREDSPCQAAFQFSAGSMVSSPDDSQTFGGTGTVRRVW